MAAADASAGSTASPTATARWEPLLGNKGANLAEMTRVLGADRVPGGFTVTTEACVEYMRTGAPPAGARRADRRASWSALEQASGKRFGDPEDPLLLSVRSGAPVSMPGMLDTILNLGLNERQHRGTGRGQRRAALRLGLAAPAGADVLRGRPRGARGRLRAGAGARPAERAGVEIDSRARPPRRCGSSTAEFLEIFSDAHRRAVPRGSPRAAPAGGDRRVRVLAATSAPSPTGG